MRSERHWSIYLPALSISILWAGILFWADSREPPLETLKLLALVVEIIAVPTLYLWAFFRARGAEVAVTSDAVTISTGGRQPELVRTDFTSVGDVRVAQSYLQKLLGAGQIRIELVDGRQFVLDDMSAPNLVAAALMQDRATADEVSAV